MYNKLFHLYCNIPILRSSLWHNSIRTLGWQDCSQCSVTMRSPTSPAVPVPGVAAGSRCLPRRLSRSVLARFTSCAWAAHHVSWKRGARGQASAPKTFGAVAVCSRQAPWRRWPGWAVLNATLLECKSTRVSALGLGLLWISGDSCESWRSGSLCCFGLPSAASWIVQTVSPWSP